MSLSNVSVVAFHYRSYGTFFYTQKGSIISTVVLPTTEIIEPNFLQSFFFMLKIKNSQKR